MNPRDALVAWARAQVGSNDRAGYWAQALGYDPGAKKAWCGAFCLAGLHAVGIATDHKWGIDGSGFIGPLGLEHHRTSYPKPGDIGYQDRPYQHHFIVTDADRHTFSSVDGNQGTPGVQERHRVLDPYKYTFYSIESLLHVADTEPSPALPVLRMGSHGPDVAELQRLLGIRDDGSFGPKTAAAVMNFQRQHGLDADGVVGKFTWEKLHGT